MDTTNEAGAAASAVPHAEQFAADGSFSAWQAGQVMDRGRTSAQGTLTCRVKVALLVESGPVQPPVQWRTPTR